MLRPSVAFTPRGSVVQVEKPVAELRVEGVILLEPCIFLGVTPEFGDGEGALVQYGHLFALHMFSRQARICAERRRFLH